MRQRKKILEILDENINQTFNETNKFDINELSSLENKIFSNIDYSLLDKKKTYYFDKVKFIKFGSITLASLILVLGLTSPLFFDYGRINDAKPGKPGSDDRGDSYLDFNDFKDVNNNYIKPSNNYLIFEIPSFDYIKETSYFISYNQDNEINLLSSTIIFNDDKEVRLIYGDENEIISIDNLDYVNSDFDKFDLLENFNGDNLKALSFKDIITNIIYFTIAYSSESENSTFFDSFLDDIASYYIKNNI